MRTRLMCYLMALAISLTCVRDVGAWGSRRACRHRAACVQECCKVVWNLYVLEGTRWKKKFSSGHYDDVRTVSELIGCTICGAPPVPVPGKVCMIIPTYEAPDGARYMTMAAGMEGWCLWVCMDGILENHGNCDDEALLNALGHKVCEQRPFDRNSCGYKVIKCNESTSLKEGDSCDPKDFPGTVPPPAK